MFRTATWSGIVVAFVLALSETASAAYSVTFNSPLPNRKYAGGAAITYSGTFAWGAQDPAIDTIEVFVMINNPDPEMGVVLNSNYATITSKVLPPQGTSGTFNSSNSTPILTAPGGRGQFWITAAPANAVKGYFWPGGQGVPPYYFASVSLICLG